MKILVVEDDSSIASTLRILLSTCNYAVDIAEDGEVGLQMAAAYDYDLILLDVLLPIIDGLSVCKELRATGFLRPILLLTGQSKTHQKAIALNAGADDYVVKPFDFEELLARIQALLRRGSVQQPILVWAHLSLDPNSRAVTYRDHLLSLTPKEYAVLEMFLRSPQTTLSTNAILEHAWNSLDVPGEEAVRVYIKQLRQKLSAVGAPKDLIQTVNRVGYRLNPVYSSALAAQPLEQLTLTQLAELQAANQGLRDRLAQQQLTQADQHQQYQSLELAYQAIVEDLKQMTDRAKELELTNVELKSCNQQLAMANAELSIVNEELRQRIAVLCSQ